MLLRLIDHSESLIELQKMFVFSVTWGIFPNTDGNYLFVMILPRVGLHCKLVPVQNG